MKVRLITEQTIRDYTRKHAPSQSSFHYWISMINNADWQQPGDISQTFPSADLLGKGSQRVVFEVGGNNHRVICQYHFGKTMVHLFVCWIGTHAEYDQLCASGKQYSVADF